MYLKQSSKEVSLHQLSLGILKAPLPDAHQTTVQFTAHLLLATVIPPILHSSHGSVLRGPTLWGMMINIPKIAQAVLETPVVCLPPQLPHQVGYCKPSPLDGGNLSTWPGQFGGLREPAGTGRVGLGLPKGALRPAFTTKCARCGDNFPSQQGLPTPGRAASCG